MTAEPFVWGWGLRCLGATIYAFFGGLAAAASSVAAFGVSVFVGIRRPAWLAARRWPVWIPPAAMALVPVLLFAGTTGCEDDADVRSWFALWVSAEAVWAAAWWYLARLRARLNRETIERRVRGA